jgi:hypothetical protein
MTKFQRARLVIQQIKNGEWIPRYNDIDSGHLTAHRNGVELWIGNGAWFCDIKETNAFGYVFRHYVWWAAARKLKRDADKNKKYQNENERYSKIDASLSAITHESTTN